MQKCKEGMEEMALSLILLAFLFISFSFLVYLFTGDSCCGFGLFFLFKIFLFLIFSLGDGNDCLFVFN